MKATLEYTPAFLARALTGRGGFGEEGGRVWLFFLALDYEIAEAAVAMWGGQIMERTDYSGQRVHKYTAGGRSALAAIEAMYPHFRGYMRERAEEVLSGCGVAARLRAGAT